MLSRKQLLNLESARVLSSWTAVLSGELMSQSLSIENTTEDVANLGKCAISVSVNTKSIRSFIHRLKIGCMWQ